ncbi:MAG: recombinase RecA [Bacilli bacterium]|nr:recombinase RecA [Bacilli bacterium]
MYSDDEIIENYSGEETQLVSGNEGNFKTFLKSIEKKFGKECIMSLDFKENAKVKRCSSGFLSLDAILGGGFPCGRIIEIFGPESSGKTTLAIHAIAEIIKNGGHALYIDAEHALDKTYVEQLISNKQNFYLAQPDNGEIAFELICNTCNNIDIIVVDSVASLIPKVELDGELQDVVIGAQARLMAKGLRKVVQVNKKAIIIFINQLRTNPGAYGAAKETTTGGVALKFYATIRLEIRKSELIKDKNNVTVGVKVKFRTVKNKVSPPYRSCFMNICYGKGFDRYADILEIAVERGFIKKTSSWYEYNNKKIGQGSEKAALFLEQNPKETNEIVSKIKSRLN